MSDISMNTIRLIWYQTRQSTWDSVSEALEYLYATDKITYDDYKTLVYAVNRAAKVGGDFPDSEGELYASLDHYM